MQYRNMKCRKTKNYVLIVLLGGVLSSCSLFAIEQKGFFRTLINKAKQQYEKIKNPTLSPEALQTYELHVLKHSTEHKKINNPRTDSERREDKKEKEFPIVENNSEDPSFYSNQNIESKILENILPIVLKYNKHIFFFCVAAGTLLAVIFPQQTKSMVHGTASKIKKFIQKIGKYFSFNTKRVDSKTDTST